MVPREKIIKKISKEKLNFNFYYDLCQVLLVCNDLQYFFKLSVTDSLKSVQLLKDIAHTIVVKVNLNGLLQMYPMYLKEHVNFYIFCQSLDLKYKILLRYYSNDIIQKNEWEPSFFEFIKNQISFIQGEAIYTIENITENNNFENKNDIKKYICDIVTPENIFYDLINYLIEELIDEL